MNDRHPPPGARARTPGLALALLLALTAAGLAIRLVGTEFCLPHIREMDSEIVTQVSHLRGKPLRSKSSRVFYATYPLLTALCTWIGTSPPPAEPPPRASLEEHLHWAGQDYSDTRKTVAVLSSLIVPITWLLARRFAGPWWGLYAAGLMGASLLHVFFSQEARPHGPTSVCFVLAMLAFFRMRRVPTAASYALVGLALAVLLGFLHSGIAMGVPLLAAHLLRDDRRLLDPRLLLTGSIVVASLPGTYWPLIDPALKDVESVVDDSEVAVPGHVVKWSRFNGGGLETTLTTMRSYEPVLSALLILALVVYVATRFLPRARDGEAEAPDRGKEALIVLAFVLPYGFMISLWEENYERFVIPLLPFLACFVAWAGRELTRRSGGALRTAVVGLFLLCLTLPGYASARLSWLRHVPDTAERAAEWIRENVDPASDHVFVTPWWDLPLVRTQETLHEKVGGKAFHVISPWKAYQAGLEPEVLPGPHWRLTTMVVLPRFDGQTVEGLREYLDYFGSGYFVIDAKKRGHPWMKWMSDELAARGELVQRISPDKDEWAWNYPLFDQDGVEPDWPDFTPRVLKARSVGPVIEIYRVD